MDEVPPGKETEAPVTPSTPGTFPATNKKGSRGAKEGMAEQLATLRPEIATAPFKGIRSKRVGKEIKDPRATEKQVRLIADGLQEGGDFLTDRDLVDLIDALSNSQELTRDEFETIKRKGAFRIKSKLPDGFVKTKISNFEDDIDYLLASLEGKTDSWDRDYLKSKLEETLNAYKTYLASDYVKATSVNNKLTKDLAGGVEKVVSVEKNRTRERDVTDIRARNIWYDNKLKSWKMKGSDKRVITLSERQGLSSWEKTLDTLKAYRTFIASTAERERSKYASLTVLKDTLLDAIESEDWEEEKNLQNELEEELGKISVSAKDRSNATNTTVNVKPSFPGKEGEAGIERPRRYSNPTYIRADNIWFDKDNKTWKIQYLDDSVEELTSDNGLDQWLTTLDLLEEYSAFIAGKNPSDYEKLISLKNDLLGAIENEHWDREKHLHIELEKELRKFYKKEKTVPPTKTQEAVTLEKRTLRDTKDVFPRNLFYDGTEHTWKIRRVGDKTESLPANFNADQWSLVREILKNYTDFLIKKNPEPFIHLIVIKDKLLDAIESEEWSEVESLYNELYEAVDNEKQLGYKNIYPKNVSQDKSTNKWTILSSETFEPLDVSHPVYQLWPAVHDELKKYQAFVNNGEKAYACHFLINTKNRILHAVEANDAEGLHLLLMSFISEMQIAVKADAEAKAFNLTKYQAGIPTLTDDSWKPAFVKSLYPKDDKVQVIKRDTGEWFALKDVDLADFILAREALQHFHTSKYRSAQAVEKKNKILTLVNEYKFEEAAKQAKEYLEIYPAIAVGIGSEMRNPFVTASNAATTTAPVAGSSMPASNPPAAGGVATGALPSVPPIPPTLPVVTAAPNPEPKEKPLDVTSVWPRSIYFDDTKGKKGWYRNINGKTEKVMSQDAERAWDAVYTKCNGTQESRKVAPPLFDEYIKFFVSGSLAEQKKKIELYTYVVDVKNLVIDELYKGNPDVALLICGQLENDLADAKENWEIEKVKLEKQITKDIETKSLAKEFEKVKKEFQKEEGQVEITLEYLSPLEREILQKAKSTAQAQFDAITKKEASGEAIDQKTYTAAENEYKKFKALLLELEKALYRKTPEAFRKDMFVQDGDRIKITDRRELDTKQIINTSNGRQIRVSEWKKEQQDNQAIKEIVQASVEDANYRRLLDEHESKYSADPEAYVKKYRNKEFISGDMEAKIVREMLQAAYSTYYKGPAGKAKIAKLDREYLNKNPWLNDEVSTVKMHRQTYRPAKASAAENNSLLKKIKAFYQGEASKQKEDDEREAKLQESKDLAETYRNAAKEIIGTDGKATSPITITPTLAKKLEGFRKEGKSSSFVGGMNGAYDKDALTKGKLKPHEIKSGAQFNTAPEAAPRAAAEASPERNRRGERVDNLARTLNTQHQERKGRDRWVYTVAATVALATLSVVSFIETRNLLEDDNRQISVKENERILSWREYITTIDANDNIRIEDATARFLDVLEVGTPDEVLMHFVRTKDTKCIEAMLDADAYMILEDNEREIIPACVDMYGENHRGNVSLFIKQTNTLGKQLEKILQATNAPQLQKARINGDPAPAVNFIPRTKTFEGLKPKMTLRDFIKEVQTLIQEADKREQPREPIALPNKAKA